MSPAKWESDIADIEDIVNAQEPVTNRNNVARRMVMPRVRKRKKVVEAAPIQADSVIPGTQNIYLKTWGCSHNNSDGEYMAGQLANYGYTITDSKEKADLWILNSCTVKSPAEDHFRNEINKAKSLGKHLVVAGCVPQGQPKSEYLSGISVLGVQQIDRVVEVVEETLKGHTVRLFGQKKQAGKKTGGASLALPKIRKNPLIEIIAINTGCLNQCTYCKTKHARGELGSYPPDDIVQRAVQSFEEGVVEIWLTSEDLGAYGHDIGVTLPELLWKLVDVIPEGCMLRLGMTNPPYILEHLEEMAKICNHPRVYAFLHVPVQSASDSVLMDMKREYCIDDFRHVVDFLKEKVPGITIATDIICGFPTETNEDFNESLALVKEYQFPSLFINQFFPRPGTPAAKMTRVDPQEVKKRTKAMSELFQSYYPYSHKVGEKHTVLVTEISFDQNFYVGHNKYYEQVLVAKDGDFMGKSIDVEITSTGKHFLKCHVLGPENIHKLNVPPPKAKGEVSGAKPVLMPLQTSKMLPIYTEKVLLTLAVVFLITASFIKAWQWYAIQ
ncbi:threonylcarbamoyladenosine tRNA methylthiotransferase isoform X2 [Octopus bimaculoides]|nr:threonylcarbamoyladenosine tRNA methylthiotransferase isoform X2 [Octopus bimaculoides]XP_014784146.1 threonylcarbamoyladenosine tRNA methylthiotransferase isoform X2 [Octopus bimaculoides]XP_014784147.1 threonylcarbamoyladenosine tRNA methylthiotransferase isoform X2 [Octopus bimaculoides]XP_052825907.1 threonylcarbamoyladenosine tRNA methylthiotransferase isoform X2 [Octopus bimaculoides]|eukprot:XP_014784145.1 PREDICTED: threonylcarbamoyladenosine tRNA methylthiotransferase-like [Octopus bimaculoides]